MNRLEDYRRAQDVFDAVLAAVPLAKWDAPSMCAAWSLRDVAGHLIWGQEQLRHWAIGRHYACLDGAPGALHPGLMAAAEPLQTFRRVRTSAVESLTTEALGRSVRLPGLGDTPLLALIPLLITDHLAHAWDIALALGLDVRLDTDLISVSLAWARNHILRAPGFFGPELSPGPEADEQTRWLAYLGRAA